VIFTVINKYILILKYKILAYLFTKIDNQIYITLDKLNSRYIKEEKSIWKIKK